jgi:hypothetical protein
MAESAIFPIANRDVVTRLHHGPADEIIPESDPSIFPIVNRDVVTKLHHGPADRDKSHSITYLKREVN